jgi:hypothetical protein
VIVNQLESERPVVEKTFSGAPEVLPGFGQLVVTAPCEGPSKAFSVCVRGSSGVYKPLAREEAAAGTSDAGKAGAGGAPSTKAEEPSGYALKADGGVVAFVNGARSGFVDLKNGHFTAVPAALTRSIDSGWCVVELSGVLRCLSSQGPVVVGPDGTAEPRPFRYKWAEAWPPHALALDDQLQLFQSDDLGRTWRQVQAPPILERSPDSSSVCSEVGCRMGPWLRLGWEARPPMATPEPQEVPLPAPSPNLKPVLACRAASAPSVAVSPLLAVDDGPQLPAFGVEALSARYFRLPIEASAPHQASLGMTGLRGLASGLVPKQQEAPGKLGYSGARPLGFRWVDYFDAKARKLSTTLDLNEMARVAQSVGSSPPDLDFDDQTSFQVVPVLGSDPGKAAGFMLSHENAHVWVRAGKASALPLEVADQVYGIVSGAAERSGRVLLLIDDGAGRSHVLQVVGGASSLLFTMPSGVTSAALSSTPDALAVTSDGDIAVLHVTSGDDPPSDAYPLLAYRPDKPIEQLAAWSTLRAAGDPACADKAGYRALLLPMQSWLALARSEPDAEQDSGMVAAVRWSKQRVCLEALELSDNPFNVADEELLTRVVARFVAKPEAGRIGFGQGMELRQPLTCELRRSP